MLNKNRIIIIVVLILLCITAYFLFLGKKQAGRLIDKINLSNNSYDIQIDDRLINDIYIYWLGENSTREHNKMLIYHRSLQSEIPPSYGANKLLIKHKGEIYDKIGVWKEYAYSKYVYSIKINKVDSFLVIDWKIKNWYDPDIMQGNDTIKIK